MEGKDILDRAKYVLISFIFCSFSIFFAYYIYPDQAPIMLTTFVVISLTPLLYGRTKREEAIVAHEGGGFLLKYSGIILTMLLLSAGIFISFMFWHGVLPATAETSEACLVSGPSGCEWDIRLPDRASVFSAQEEYARHWRGLDTVLFLILMSFLLSLFFGAGAILIITWDLSVLAVSGFGYLGFLIYLPQLLAFFLTGLAGALLSFAILRHEWKTKGMFIVLRDSAVLLAVSLLLAPIPYFLITTH